MGATRVKNALPGEDFLGIEPELLQFVDPGWRHRLAMFTGRALSDTALKNEQLYRAGRLALLGQAVTPGTVTGLTVSVDLTAADPVLQVTPGYGISANGADVTLLSTMKTALSTLPVIDPATGLPLQAFKDYSENAAHQSYVGVLLLQPVIVQANGLVLDSGTAPLEVSGQLGASCDQDPEEYAFEDWQITDATRLVLVAWPTAPAALALPATEPAATWRNRLAYTVFAAEAALGAEDYLPWEYFGVPLALAGFSNTWALQFLDRAAVVRAGVRRGGAHVLPGDSQLTLIQPASAQSRILQLAEQISGTPGLPGSAFALLPPSGVLQASVLDFVNRKNVWLPENWSVKAAPVHEEEIETVLLTGMMDAPLDTTQPESVEVLVPLPDAVYDPKILVTEVVAPEFQATVDTDTNARNSVLQHRKNIQVEANALLTAVGQPLIVLDTGLTAAELAARDGAAVYTPDPNETFGATLVNNVVVSADIQSLQKLAAAPPYTITGPNNQPLGLLNAADWQDLSTYGLQHLINRLNAKIAKADDLLDLGLPYRAGPTSIVTGRTCWARPTPPPWPHPQFSPISRPEKPPPQHHRICAIT